MVKHKRLWLILIDSCIFCSPVNYSGCQCYAVGTTVSKSLTIYAVALQTILISHYWLSFDQVRIHFMKNTADRKKTIPPQREYWHLNLLSLDALTTCTFLCSPLNVITSRKQALKESARISSSHRFRGCRDPLLVVLRTVASIRGVCRKFYIMQKKNSVTNH